MSSANRQINSHARVIGEILGSNTYRYKVPVYQRNFAWQKDQVNTLWEDLTGALENNANEYFLGAIVISIGEDDSHREIIDGQQRLVAISMILAAIVRQLRLINDDKTADSIFRDYLGAEDRRTGDIESRLTLNEINDPSFQELVIEQRSFSKGEVKNWIDSNKLLYEAFEITVNNLNKWLEKFPGMRDALIDLEEFIQKRTKLIVIEAGDESDAFIIFETLNDRGLELAVSDLVKNYLFSLAGTNLETFKGAWRDMMLLIGEENMPQYLRHFWLSRYGHVQKRELYRAIREKIKSNIIARKFMEDLRKDANLYSQ